MSSATAFWGKQIAVEEIRGVPFRMYSDRPRRIEHLFPFADHWGARPHIVQGERVVTFEGLRHASAAKAQRLIENGAGRGDRAVDLVQPGVVHVGPGVRLLRRLASFGHVHFRLRRHPSQGWKWPD